MTRPHMTSDEDAYDVAALWCVRLVEGSLSESDRIAFEAWLQMDARHRDVLESVAGTWEALGNLAEHPEMLRHRRDARGIVETARHKKSVWSGGSHLRRLAVAACFALVAVAVVLFYAQRPMTYETGIGERQIVRLADGSSISLDGDTKVRVRYTDNHRRLWLERGRARFNVHRDPLRPFSVDADDRVVVATGTSFSVERVANQVRVALFEGSVVIMDEGTGTQIAAPQGREAPAPALAVNQEIVLLEGQGVSSAPIENVNAVRATSWEGGLLTFEAEPLYLAVARVNRYADQPVSVAPSAASLEISGTFRAGDTAGFVEGISAVLPVTADETSSGFEIRHSRL